MVTNRGLRHVVVDSKLLVKTHMEILDNVQSRLSHARYKEDLS